MFIHEQSLLKSDSKGYIQIQIDEIKSLQSIYYDELLIINEDERIFEIKLQIEEKCGTLKFSLPKEYPDSPPICEIGIPWIRGIEKQSMENEIQNLVYENIGCTVVYQIVESIREQLYKTLRSEVEDISLPENNVISSNEIEAEELFTVFHGDPFIDRKSTFQAHISHVKSEEEVSIVKRQLLLNNKIATATHNISAYRLRTPGNSASKLIQSCDDDGENKAGERLLNMMVLMGVENIYVVVSRWFGGVKLGPDRFKHINNTAKDAIIKCGWFPPKTLSGK